MHKTTPDIKTPAIPNLSATIAYSVDLADVPRARHPINTFTDPPIMPKSSSSASTTANPFADPPSRTQTDIELGEISGTMQHHPSATTPSNGSGSGSSTSNKASIWARTTSFLRTLSFVDVLYLLYLLNAFSALLAVSIYAGIHAHDQDTTICEYGPYRNTDGSIPDAAAWIAAWATSTVVAGHSVAVLQAIVSGGLRPRGRYSDNASQAGGLKLYRGLALIAGWFFGVLIVVVGVCAYL